MKNCGDFSIFLRALVNELWMMKKKERKKGGQNGQFCSEITRLHERLGEGYIELCKAQVKLICLNCFGWPVLHASCMCSYTYVEAAILNLFNPYIRSCIRIS